MCALCGILVDGPHWTESGTDGGRSDSNKSNQDQYLEKAHRIKILNIVLRPLGARAEDWSGQYIVRNLAGGASDVAPNLPAIWKSLEYILNREIDPLDPDFLLKLEKVHTDFEQLG